jgi:hypothetical protein
MFFTLRGCHSLSTNPGLQQNITRIRKATKESASKEKHIKINETAKKRA